jgi:hypothetical protein
MYAVPVALTINPTASHMSNMQSSVIDSLRSFAKMNTCEIEAKNDVDRVNTIRVFLDKLFNAANPATFNQISLLCPFVYHNLKDFQSRGEVPDEVLDPLKRGYYQTASSNLLKLNAATKIFKALQQEDILAIPLKGIALVETLYKNPAIRPMTDIDLLVKTDDFQRIKDVLESIGYRLTDSYRGSYNFADEKNRVLLDLHSKFLRYEILFRIDDAEIYKRLCNINFNDQVLIRVLCPEHQLVHIALHLAPGLYSDLNIINLLDLYLMLSNREHSIDWEYLVDFAERSGISSYMYAPLMLCSELFNVSIPQFVLPSLGCRLSPGKNSYIQNHYLTSILNGSGNGSKIVFERLVWAEGVPARLKLIRMALFPDRREMADRYHIPEKSARLYGLYAVRLWKLLRNKT